MSSFPSRSGQLQKRGALWTAWRWRQFVLHSGRLSYYKSGKLAGTIPLAHDWKVNVLLLPDRPYAFELEPPRANKRNYVIATNTLESRDEWVKDIKATIALLSPLRSNPNIQTPPFDDSEPIPALPASSPLQEREEENDSEEETEAGDASNAPPPESDLSIESQENHTIHHHHIHTHTHTSQQQPTHHHMEIGRSLSGGHVAISSTPPLNPTNAVVVPDSDELLPPPSPSSPPTQPRTASRVSVTQPTHSGATAVLMVAVLHLVLGATLFSYLEKWDWFDAFYFSYVTLTTIGYGDFVPKSSFSRLCLIGYAITGLGIIAQLISVVQQKAIERVLARDSTSTAPLHLKRRVVVSVLAYFSTILFGAPLFRTIEGWSLRDSLYFSVVTLTTIGYGDMVPSFTYSRVVMILYSAFGICLVAFVIAAIQEFVLSSTHGRLLASSMRSDGPVQPNISATARRVFRLCVFTCVVVVAFAVLMSSLSDVKVIVEEIENVGNHEQAATHKATLNIPDALYFAVVTMTTIGYGDITPSTAQAKWCVIAFAFVLVAYLGAAIQTLQSILLDLEHLAERLLFPEKLWASAMLPGTRRLVGVAVMILFHFLFGAIVFGEIEQWDWLTSFYWATVTTSTIGFGDIHPTTTLGKALFVPFALIGIALLAFFVTAIGERERQRLVVLQQQAEIELANITL